MTIPSPVFTQYTSAGQVAPDLRQALTECWVEVTNAGGAAGFPFPPVETAEAASALETIINSLRAVP
ncbi:hypothetical protein [Streptomyces sp. NPDC001966]